MRAPYRVVVIFVFPLLLLFSPALAQVTTFRKEVKQIMGSAQSQDDARAAALAKARRDAVEEAGVWLESQSVVQNFKLEKDQVTTLATGITQTRVVEEGPYIDGGAVGYRVVAEVQVDNSGLAERVKQFLADRAQVEQAKASHEREQALLARLAALERQMAEMKNASEAEKATLRGAIQSNARQLTAQEWFDKGFALYNKETHEHSDPKEAIKDYSRAIALEPEFLDAYFFRAAAKENLEFGRSEGAIEDYDQVLRIDPNFAVGYLKRGRGYKSLGMWQFGTDQGLIQFKRAILDYDQALRLDPSLTNVYQERAEAYQHTNQPKQAIQDYDKFIALNPETKEAYRERGDAYADSGQLERAIQDFSQHVRLNPDDGLAFIARGDAYLSLGEFQRAIEDYDHTQSLVPEYRELMEHGRFLTKRGRAYLGLGQYQHAIETFDKAIADSSDPMLEYQYRGIAYSGLGQHKRAIQDFDQSISLMEQWRHSSHAVTPPFSWQAVTQEPWFEKLTPEEKGRAQRKYFTDYVQPNGISWELFSGTNLSGGSEPLGTVKPTPYDAYVRPFLASSYYYRGKSLDALGQKDRAIENWQKACQLGEKNACRLAEKNPH